MSINNNWNDRKNLSRTGKDLLNEEENRRIDLLIGSTDWTEQSVCDEADELGDDSPLVATLDMSVRSYPLLTAERERELLAELAGEDKAAAERALELLVYSNVRIIMVVASRYANAYNCEFSDLFQSGIEGLMRALRKFDVERGVRLLTYALSWIEQYIARAAAGSPTVHIPDNKLTLLRRVRSARKKLIAQNQSYPTAMQIAELTGIACTEVEKILLFAEGSPISYDGQVSDDNDTPLAEVAGGESPFDSPENAAVDSVAKDELSGSIQDLLGTVLKRHPKEHLVINLRFGLDGFEPHTLDQTAGELGVSRERIRQLESKALSRLRVDCRTKAFMSFID